MSTTFDDGKEDGALRTIGEVGKALGLKPHVLRYWEEQFPTLEPLKRSGNRRYYRPEDVALVEVIDRLVNHEGYTLKGARQAIEEGRAAVSGSPQEDAKPADDHVLELDNDSAEAESAKPAPAQPDMDTGRGTGIGDAQVAAEVLAELKEIRGRLAAAVGG